MSSATSSDLAVSFSGKSRWLLILVWMNPGRTVPTRTPRFQSRFANPLRGISPGPLGGSVTMVTRQ
jgi:hypothetical protein